MSYIQINNICTENLAIQRQRCATVKDDHEKLCESRTKKNPIPSRTELPTIRHKREEKKTFQHFTQ